jgi:hypothetical protein
MREDFKLVKSLEIELAREEVRANPNRLAELLHENFSEFGMSGRTYDKEAIVSALPTWEYLGISFGKITPIELSSEVIMLKYQSTLGGIKANRTSIWILDNENWQMLHHQGTKC